MSSGQAFLVCIVLAALDRSGSVLPILCAMAVHELAHVVMMLACGGQVRRLTLRFADLQIAASGLGYRQELLSALAGPLVNLICGAAFCMQRPSFAAYSLMLGIYNLLPVWPLDGGRMIRCVLLARLPITQAEHISEIVSFAACAVLLLIGVFLTFFRKSGLGRWNGGLSDRAPADACKTYGCGAVNSGETGKLFVAFSGANRYNRVNHKREGSYS